MEGYFKPRLRKIGVVTLVISLGLICGWVRSLDTEDAIDCTFGCTRIAIASVNRRIFLVRQTYLDSSRAFGGFPIGGGFCIGGGSNSHPTSYENGAWKPTDFTASPGCDVDWRWDWIGFHSSSGVMVPQGFRFEYRLIPYWCIVIPLALLSASLLLTTHRKSSQMRITDPIPDKLE